MASFVNLPINMPLKVSCAIYLEISR